MTTDTRRAAARLSRTALGAVLVSGLLLAGCGGTSDAPADAGPATSEAATAPATSSGAGSATTANDSPDASSAPAATTQAPAVSSAAPVETRPEILLLGGPQLDGQSFDLTATAGNDVLMWFWAPW